MDTDWLDEIKWNADALVPVVTQESGSGKVLMLAWMNREALQRTVALGQAVYWSRSRQKLWHKGETSGNTLKVNDIRLDCDGDALLLEVQQSGAVACHTGRHSCFFRQLQSQGQWKTIEPVLKNPDEMYGPAL